MCAVLNDHKCVCTDIAIHFDICTGADHSIPSTKSRTALHEACNAGIGPSFTRVTICSDAYVRGCPLFAVHQVTWEQFKL